MVLPKAIVNHHIKKVIFSTALNKKKLTPPLLNGFKTLIGGALLSSFQQANTNTFLLPAIPAAHQCKSGGLKMLKFFRRRPLECRKNKKDKNLDIGQKGFPVKKTTT